LVDAPRLLFDRSNVLSQVNIPIPDDAMAALNLSPVEAAEEFRFAAAAKLYELGRLSSGAAASLAGVPRAVFLNRLSEYGVSAFRGDEEELKQDLSRA
jgi:predicted HTH domain antitoxin